MIISSIIYKQTHNNKKTKFSIYVLKHKYRYFFIQDTHDIWKDTRVHNYT